MTFNLIRELFFMLSTFSIYACLILNEHENYIFVCCVNICSLQYMTLNMLNKGQRSRLHFFVVNKINYCVWMFFICLYVVFVLLTACFSILLHCTGNLTSRYLKHI